MVTLVELKEHRNNMMMLVETPIEGFNENMTETCNVAYAMFDALIKQLENQTISFTL